MLSVVISGCDGNSPKPPPDVLTSPEAMARGAGLFAQHCAICHGVKADGQGARQRFMNPPPANLTLPRWRDAANAGAMYAAIRNGVRGTAMPAWPSLTDQQAWTIVAYIRSLNSHKAH